jgi:thioredoxin 1
MAELKITAGNFDREVKRADKPVLLDFWADWCGPCRMLSPTVSQIAEEYSDKIKVGKVNVDEEPDLSNSFGVQSIPMLVLMRRGQIIASSIGNQPVENIRKLIDDNI